MGRIVTDTGKIVILVIAGLVAIGLMVSCAIGVAVINANQPQPVIQGEERFED